MGGFGRRKSFGRVEEKKNGSGCGKDEEFAFRVGFYCS